MAKRSDDDLPVDLPRTVEGLFRGLGNLLEKATELAGKADQLSHTEVVGDPNGLRAEYGVSVRFGAAAAPAAAPFKTVRRPVDPVREPATDFFDEDDHYLVVAELPGINEADVQWSASGDVLTIRAACGDRKYGKEIRLPSPVDPAKTHAAYKNGILELRLWKRAKR